MKGTLIALCAILAVSTARVVINAETSPHLLGANRCTWGPSYWCENIKTSAECNATHHCIKKFWEQMVVPEDTDSVCQVCKDMVQQARDQLESNQTQQDLKAVFEGSCMLIHIKPIVKECIKLVDDFIPQLVETLASQMNPSVVCTVAGLCNSAHLDKLLLDHQKSVSKVMSLVSLDNDEIKPDECSKCYTIATHMEYKFNKTSKDKMAEQMIEMCGYLGSYSDACSSIILTNFNAIYSHLRKNFNAGNICHLSGQCADKFHKHDDTDTGLNVEVKPLSSVGMVEISDDLPCKLCEQLVIHLRDLLVANTTEAEFQLVLEGLCKQTKSFATECKAIVDEYYPEIYVYLTKGLNGNFVCQMSGICPRPGKALYNGPMWPLLPETSAKIGLEMFGNREKKEESEGAADRKEKLSEAEEMQLPIERTNLPLLMQSPQMDARGQQTCAFCEYFLHYLQEALTYPLTEEKVKEAIGKACKKLPETVENICDEFVDVYGDAVVALLAEAIDPSKVCPMIHICPTKEFMEAFSKEKEHLLDVEKKEKPSCPLCLLAVSQIYNVIKDNKTEANIEAELGKLCSHLPTSLVEECTDLVKGYSKELVELLIADLTPQEVCVYIKLCNPQNNTGPRSPMELFPVDNEGEIMTNEIPSVPLYPLSPRKVGDATCVVCEFIMEHIDQAIGNKKTRNKIEKIVHGVCNYLPKTVSKECNDFVKEYADVVIDILTQDVSPKEVCTMIDLCKLNKKQIEESVAECAVCQATVSAIDRVLDNPKVDSDIEDVVSKACTYLPASKQNKCTLMMEVYAQSIINLIRQGDREKICSAIALCSPNDYLVLMAKNPRTRRSYENQLGSKRCTWGSTYWCTDHKTAAECGALNHCKLYVWKGQTAPADNQTAVQAQ